MEWTIQKLSQLAGVSTRTLRYYDEIGLLIPARLSSSGYRIYGQNEIDCLQQILFYKELGVDLETIKEILSSSTFDVAQALKEHRATLLEKREQLNRLLDNVEKSIAANEGRMDMSNQEKFEGFKREKIAENEKKYGKEIRQKYGNEKVDQSNSRFMGLSEEDFKRASAIETKMKETIALALANGEGPGSEMGQKVAELHKEWLCFYWPSYSPEAHSNVTQMYVDDERFTVYYDSDLPGSAQFLRDAVWKYAGMTS